MMSTALPLKPKIMRGRRKRNPVRGWTVFKALMLIGLIAWTISNGLKRPALQAAETAFAKAKKSGDAQDWRVALQYSLDDLRTFRLSRNSSLIAARSLSKLRYPDDAERHYRTASWYGQLPLDAQHDRMQGLFRAMENDRCIALCNEVLARYPDDPTTLQILATAEWVTGRLKQAREAAERLARTESGQIDGLDLLATIHRKADRREDAVAACEEILRVDPELKRYRPATLGFWLEFTDDLVVLHRAAEARDYLLKVITPYSDPYLLDILGSAYKDLKDYDAAEKTWRESVRRKPDRFNAWFRLGSLAKNRKRFADAIEPLEKAVRITPEHLQAHQLLGEAYQFTGRADDAKKQFEIADEIRRTGPPPPGGMGPAQ